MLLTLLFIASGASASSGGFPTQQPAATSANSASPFDGIGPDYCYIGVLITPAIPGCVGPAATVTVSLQPSSIPANGTSTTVATATVEDSSGDLIAGDNITFSANQVGVTIGSVTDHGDGTYTATVTSSSTTGTVTITAIDTSPDPNVSGFAPLTLTSPTSGQAATVTVGLSPPSITANGTSTSTATATVEDSSHGAVTGDNITFSANPSGVTIGSVVNNHDGTYSATITSTTTAGPVVITATDTSVSPDITGQGTLTLNAPAGPAATVTVGLSPSSLTANGTSTSTATATVEDASSHPVEGDHITFSANPTGVTIGSVVNHGDGTYSATITSTTTAGPVVITATDTSVSPNVSGQATLTLSAVVAGPATTLGVALSPTSITADGVSTATATATVRDAGGLPVIADNLSFSASPSLVALGPVVTHEDGTYSVTVTSSTTLSTVTITATDLSVTPNLIGTAALTLAPPPPPPPPPAPTTTSATPTTPATTTTPVKTNKPATGPTTSKIDSSLTSTLAPSGADASIKAILKHGTYAFSYKAPGAGKLTIDWYEGSGKKRKLIGSVSTTIKQAGKTTPKLKLTGVGRTALKHSKRLSLTSSVSFKATGKSAVTRTAKFTLH
jgi:adhesin/invasin